MNSKFFGKSPSFIIIDELGLPPANIAAQVMIVLRSHLDDVHRIHEDFIKHYQGQHAKLQEATLVIDTLDVDVSNLYNKASTIDMPITEIPSQNYVAPKLELMKEKSWIEMNNKHLKRRFRTGRRE